MKKMTESQHAALLAEYGFPLDRKPAKRVENPQPVPAPSIRVYNAKSGKEVSLPDCIPLKIVYFDDIRYQRSHGKPPRGRGGWIFEDRTGTLHFNVQGGSWTYAESKKAVRSFALTHGIGELWVCP